MTKEKRVTFVPGDDILRWLETKHAETGAPLGEIIRRELRKAIGPAPVERRDIQLMLLSTRREDANGAA